MRAGPDARRPVVALLLTGLLAGCGGSPDASTPPRVATTTAAPTPLDEQADGDDGAADRAYAAAGRRAARALARRDADDAWAIPDAFQRPMDLLWDARRGVYVSATGTVSTRLNAEMLRIHAAAAIAGHRGEARRDDRVTALVTYLTGPAFLRTLEEATFGPDRSNTIHVPGWRQSSSEIVNQHPSIDATVARGLRAAWESGERAGLSGELRDRIRDTVVSVASSEEFRHPARLLNQINWNAELYAAAVAVGGDAELLRRDYREQLLWFARHADTPVRPGGSPNLSRAGGFRYQPEAAPDSPSDRSDTVEYANTVLGALRHLQQALDAGMEPLPADARAVLDRWATHTLDADWTTAGYLNWESGKGRRRVHLRQYWALALDGAVSALRGGVALTGRPAGDGDVLLARGDRLFRRWVERDGTVLLPATDFGFRSSFASVRDNRTTTTSRMAATIAEWASRTPGRRLPDVTSTPSPLVTRLDTDLRRLAVNGPTYSTAISPTAVPTGGGVEPAWILDDHNRQLGALGGGGDGSLGLRLTRGDRTVLDTQPGVPDDVAEALPTVRPVRGEVDTYTATIETDAARVTVSHRFLADRIITRYVINPRRPGTRVALRIPSAGHAARIECVRSSGAPRQPGCPRGSDYRVRADEGARMRVRLQGIPARAAAETAKPRRRSAAPRPGQQLEVVFTLRGRTEIVRTLVPG
ncbi:MAG: hypothetical protein AB7G37_13000 [Solirubrobacteraceae bacterium]